MSEFTIADKLFPSSGDDRPPKRWIASMFLLLFTPLAMILWMADAPDIWRFAASSLAIIPLAGLMGQATERLSERLGPGIGGLLNATFGNAAELILALFALARGLDEVVKASLTGSVIGNVLLVLGASLCAGGMKYRIQRFNKAAAGMGGTLLVLAAVGMLIPAIFHNLIDARSAGLEVKLSVSVSIVLIGMYALSLLFSLKTHRELYQMTADETRTLSMPEPESQSEWSLRKSSAVLGVATGLVALMSEILVGAVERTSESLGLSAVFVGVIVVAVVGNAAEHSSAVAMALKNKADLAVSIAMGSALQIALFVAPILVFASCLRRKPMDLVFRPLEVVAVILAVLIARMVAEDGESNWLEGAMLLAIYAMLALAFYYLPA